MKRSSLEKTPNGYVIQLYQYARRYRYNYEGCLNYFNYLIEKNEKSRATPDVLTFGDFDSLQTVCVGSFREYRKISSNAKEWLGKRQGVLLYDISERNADVKYDQVDNIWKKTGAGSDEEDKKRFFCLTMLSLTNEVMGQTGDICTLLRKIREKIQDVIRKLNDQSVCDISCDVFGTFNTSELGVIWLSDQYVDILRIIKYVKHIKIKGKDQDTEYPVFLNSFSVITEQKQKDLPEVRGEALVQLMEHEFMESYADLQQFVKDIVGGDDSEGSVMYSVGEYDATVRIPAKRALELVRNNGLLAPGECENETFENETFKITPRKILVNNIRLQYIDDHLDEADQKLKAALEGLEKDKTFTFQWDTSLEEVNYPFLWKDLKSKKNPDYTALPESGTIAEAFKRVRGKLSEKVDRSAGAAYTLDLLYTDYLSAISFAYSAIWSTDLNRQFRAVLYAVEQLMSEKEDLPNFWDEFLNLTNVFKQQIYHLSQSSRMFFEIPSCHLRSTGQYDFLMHAYYGITKQIIELIYRLQGKHAQSELVPLITVNTVPQVRSQLYFELEKDDIIRVINLDIPNSVIFDLRRGAWYLTHELFHYAVPEDRKKRNHLMKQWLLKEIFTEQFLYLFWKLVSKRYDGTEDDDLKGVISKLKSSNKDIPDKYVTIIDDVKNAVLQYMINHLDTIQKQVPDSDEINSSYQKNLILFATGEKSEAFFREMFVEIEGRMCTQLLSKWEDLLKLFTTTANLEKFKDRLKYCQQNTQYIERFVQTEMKYRSHADLANDMFRMEAGRIELIWNRWNAVRETCSDVAMISLNHILPEDYFIFCIQTLRSTQRDKAKVLENMKNRLEEPQWLRFGLVMQYFSCRSDEDGVFRWDISMKYDESTLLSESAKESFFKKYIWQFATIPLRKGAPKSEEEIKKLYEDAGGWLKFFISCREYFMRHHARDYGPIFVHVLRSYDVDVRVQPLKEENKAEITPILQGFREKITESYGELVNDFDLKPDEIESATDEDNIQKFKAFYETYNDKKFKFDISMSQYFQKQKSLGELKKINEEIIDTRKTEPTTSDDFQECIQSEPLLDNSPDESCWEFHVYSLEELLFYIQHLTGKLKEQEALHGITNNGNDPMIWFRGQSNETYLLYPLSMRKYERVHKSGFTLRNYHQSNYEEFKFRADGTPEMPVGVRFTQSDYIALMQHYGAPSNFLDWTDDAFTSLYMALKYFSGSSGADKSKQHNVVLYIFAPRVYNTVRTESISRLKRSFFPWYRRYPFFESLYDSKNYYSSLIPNLSVKENEARFQSFLLGDVGFDEFVHKKKRSRDYASYQDDSNKALFMPLAILTSRLNPRIRTQNGNFVAFNLYTPEKPEKIISYESKHGILHLARKKVLFRHCSLDRIQEEKCKNTYKDPKKRDIFLYRIVIDKECCEDVVKWLKSLGLSKENVYPELSEKSYHFD